MKSKFEQARKLKDVLGSKAPAPKLPFLAAHNKRSPQPTKFATKARK